MPRKNNSEMISCDVWIPFKCGYVPIAKKAFWERTGLKDKMALNTFNRAINGLPVTAESGKEIEMAFIYHHRKPMALLRTLWDRYDDYGKRPGTKENREEAKITLTMDDLATLYDLKPLLDVESQLKELERVNNNTK